MTKNPLNAARKRLGKFSSAIKYEDMISTLKMIPPNGEPNAAEIPAALAIESISILLELEDPYLWRYTGRRIKSFAMHAARCTNGPSLPIGNPLLLIKMIETLFTSSTLNERK